MKKLLGIALLTTAMVSCSSSDELTGDTNQDTQIRVSSKINFLRSTYDTQLHEGTKVGIYIAENERPLEYGGLYDNIEHVADGNGLFTSPSQMYYPQNGSKVDLYAYHPFQATNPEDVRIVPFSIKADQTLLEDYLASDLLWANVNGVERSHSIVPLLFQHKLSKLEFVVKKGTGIADLMNLNKIEVLQVAPETVLDFVTGEIAEATGTPVNVNVMGIQPTTEPEHTNGEAIVVPQTLASGKKLIQITMGEVKYSYTLPSEVVFESGKKYIYTITVNMGGIEVSSSIEDWKDGGSSAGDGNMD